MPANPIKFQLNLNTNTERVNSFSVITQFFIVDVYLIYMDV